MARTGLGNPAFLLRACLESRTVPLACLSRGFQPHASQAMPRAGNPRADRLEARAGVLGGKCWTTPVVSNGRVYARSTSEAVCLEIGPKSASR